MSELASFGAVALAACTLAMVAGGTVKGVVGLGLPLVSLPVMASFIPVPKAMALLLLPSFATSVWQSVHGGLLARSLRRFWPLLAGLAVGTFASVRMLAAFDAAVLYLILGSLVAAFALLLHRRLVFTVAPRAEPWLAPLAGLAAGLVGGLSMLFGTVYAVYLSGLALDKEEMVAAISLANVWATLVLAAAMARFDLIGGADLAASLLALVPAFGGVLLGTWLRGRIDEELFRKTLAAVLFLIGLNLVRRAFA